MTTFQVRGSVDIFLHTGAVLMGALWLILAIGVFVMYPQPEKIVNNIEGLAGLLLFMMSPIPVIKAQTISIDGEYLIYSSNFFPLIKRKIKISEISSIGFRKNFMPIADPTGISRGEMGITDQPIVGLAIYDNQGRILGGFNTKVYLQSDLDLVLSKLSEINPKIEH